MPLPVSRHIHLASLGKCLLGPLGSKNICATALWLEPQASGYIDRLANATELAELDKVCQ